MALGVEVLRLHGSGERPHHALQVVAHQAVAFEEVLQQVGLPLPGDAHDHPDRHEHQVIGVADGALLGTYQTQGLLGTQGQFEQNVTLVPHSGVSHAHF